MSRTVVVTGAAGAQAQAVGTALAQQPDVRVLGLDARPIDGGADGIEYIQADIRNPLLADRLTVEQVDAIVHMAFEPRVRRSESVFERNVVGTMRLFGAAGAAGVRKIVFPSSTMIYGAVPTHSVVLPETTEFQGRPVYSYLRELREIETFINGFRRQAPEMTITTLRFAHPLGPAAAGPLARWLSLAAAPVPLGFDPRMQIIHTADVVNALVHAVEVDAPGIYNVAADDEVLTVLQLLGIVGKVPLPVVHLFLHWGVDLTKALNPSLLSVAPLEPAFLRFACVADTTRMRDELGFAPQYTAREAVNAFAAVLRTRRYAGLGATTYALRDQLEEVIDMRRRLNRRADLDSSDT